ncbi:peptidoglycan DD-metalloendopeptidase family protein [Aureimonas phyllosphaerae]|uniref:peptidoglycan DD-metalloendopeptidase family protein n=1 Tax=Aureimonas phyllosphaerae TaxID=1166078 RepID=UPI003A5C17A1
MRTHVMRLFRQKLIRSAALVSVVSITAGCSADATRLQDGFYTGAIPKAPIQSTQVAAAPVAPAYQAPQQTYAAVETPAVSRSSLPPPPASSYGNAPAAASSYPAPAPVESATAAPIGQAQVAQSSMSRAVPAASGSRSASVTVESGDSLLGIARRSGVSVADLRAANGLTNDNIRIGQTLMLPGGTSAPASANTRVASLGAPPTTLQAQAAAIPAPRAAPANRPVAAATPAASAATAPAHAAAQAPKPAQPAVAAATATPAAPAAPAAPKASDTAVAAAAPAPATTVAKEEEKEEASLAPASTGIDQFRWPVQGRVVKNFGDKVGSRRNDGLNISVPRGTPIKAAENGVVIYAGEGLKEFGKTVLVKHDNGLVTVYGHADDILVQRGSTVKRGQEIAKAGMTGDADAPMVHFEVRKDSSPVNPMTYLR